MNPMTAPHETAPDLPAALAAAWPSEIGAGSGIEVGLSGGLDSVVLLHVLAGLRERFGFGLQAVHVHHGLNAAADEWAQFCRTLCERLAVPLRLEKVQVGTAGLGVEAAARKARYQAFAASRCGVLALAHHRDDQVETFLLAALRGGGLRALAAMPEWRPLNGKTRIWRPLLAFRRDELAAYAAAYGWDFVQDSSNADNALLRNWLRNEGLPPWRDRLPHLDAHIVHSIGALQDELALLEEISGQDWQAVHHNGSFDVCRWRALSDVRRRQQLLRLAKHHHLGMPGSASVADFAQTLLHLQTASAQWHLPHGHVYAYRNRLFAQPHDWLSDCPWLPEGKTSTGRLNNLLTENGFTLRPNLFGLREEVLNSAGGIRAVAAADVINLAVGRKSVGKILQECKVPPFVRPYWPIVTDSENRCVAIANVWVNVHYGCRNGVLPVFEPFNRFILEPK
ncbi:tRNA lysidine(34) synthetase TilS [Uruburuella testudinis]|uniref:tRNA(Ile)-lysidine synthase n=1 Tax=Uruburuella testudinis TaxID=1282863 RepID=A0ABY4DQ74_9NEIS|nr:tRNA lysidine(34) synthetase TilS [Uruburuella testudinis]UOO80767.1 tRNA lysidine(34) synthetase TilS [Uruburuella testudinis]